jgi:hypothetical protein
MVAGRTTEASVPCWHQCQTQVLRMSLAAPCLWYLPMRPIPMHLACRSRPPSGWRSRSGWQWQCQRCPPSAECIIHRAEIRRASRGRRVIRPAQLGVTYWHSDLLICSCNSLILSRFSCRSASTSSGIGLPVSANRTTYQSVSAVSNLLHQEMPFYPPSVSRRSIHYIISVSLPAGTGQHAYPLHKILDHVIALQPR